YSDRTNPMDKHMEVMFENYEFSHGPVTAQLFGNAGVEHMKKYGDLSTQNKNSTILSQSKTNSLLIQPHPTFFKSCIA
ncbi:hypothetical protein CAPTEDRAFT_108170, partial [Capitella teleta]